MLQLLIQAAAGCSVAKHQRGEVHALVPLIELLNGLLRCHDESIEDMSSGAIRQNYPAFASTRVDGDNKTAARISGGHCFWAGGSLPSVQWSPSQDLQCRCDAMPAREVRPLRGHD